MTACIPPDPQRRRGIYHTCFLLLFIVMCFTYIIVHHDIHLLH